MSMSVSRMDGMGDCMALVWQPSGTSLAPSGPSHVTSLAHMITGLWIQVPKSVARRGFRLPPVRERLPSVYRMAPVWPTSGPRMSPSLAPTLT